MNLSPDESTKAKKMKGEEQVKTNDEEIGNKSKTPEGMSEASRTGDASSTTNDDTNKTSENDVVLNDTMNDHSPVVIKPKNIVDLTNGDQNVVSELRANTTFGKSNRKSSRASSPVTASIRKSLSASGIRPQNDPVANRNFITVLQ